MNSTSSPYAFTGHFPIYRGRVVSDIILCSPEECNPNAIRIRALWDTGCNTSIISKRVANFLQLQLGRQRQFRTPFNGRSSIPMADALICVVLGGARIQLEVGVDESPNSDSDCDITLGLDFITQGDFAISHDGQQLVLSFCYPPIGTPTDFSVILPRILHEKIVTEVCDINESDAVEARRRTLMMFDNYYEAAQAAKKRDEEESCTEK